METFTAAEVTDLVKPGTIENYSRLISGARGYQYLLSLFKISEIIPGMTCLQVGLNAGVREYAVRYVEERRKCGQISLEPDIPFSINKEPAIDRDIKNCLDGEGLDFPKVCIISEAEGGCHYSLRSREGDHNRTQCPLLALKLKKLRAQQAEVNAVPQNNEAYMENQSREQRTIDFDPFKYDRLDVIGSDPTTVLIQVIMQRAGVICFSPRIANTHIDREIFSRMAFDEGVDRKGIKRSINSKSITPDQAQLILRMKKMLFSGGSNTLKHQDVVEIREQLLLHLQGLARMGVIDTTLEMEGLRENYEIYGMETPGTVIADVSRTAKCIDFVEPDPESDLENKYRVDFKKMEKIHKPGFGKNSSPFCHNCKLASTKQHSREPLCPIIRADAEKVV